MSLTHEKLDGNMAKLTITQPAEKLEESITKAYQKIKNQISMPGFRKGKAPQKLVERTYGVEVFYEDAANFLMNDTYYDEVEACELEIVSPPEIEVVQIERGKDFIYTATVAIKPDVELGKYKGLEYTEGDTSVTDEEIDAELKKAQEMNSRRVPVEDRPAAEGDIVDIDYEGSVDGELFEGGSAKEYSLTLGSHTFIDNFEEQIAGHNPGDEFDVTVTFPEDYGAENLAGKEAVFKCKLNEIKTKEVPPLDDEFAEEVSEFDTLEEYKADIKKTIAERKENEAKRAAKDELIDEAVENAKMDIPEPMLSAQQKQVAYDFELRMSQSGISMDQYLKMVGQTADQFLEQVKPSALKSIQTRLVLEAIAKAEGLEASDEELEEEIKKMADAYQMDIEKLKEALTDKEKASMKNDIAMNKASDFLYENGKAVKKKKEEKPKKEAKEKEPEEKAAEKE